MDAFADRHHPLRIFGDAVDFLDRFRDGGGFRLGVDDGDRVLADATMVTIDTTFLAVRFVVQHLVVGGGEVRFRFAAEHFEVLGVEAVDELLARISDVGEVDAGVDFAGDGQLGDLLRGDVGHVMFSFS